MSETVKQLYNGNIPESLYNDTKRKLEYLEGLVGELSVDKIDHLNRELETVKTERDSYSGQVKQLELRIQDLKKAHEDGKARQRRKWEADVDYYKIYVPCSKTLNITLSNLPKDYDLYLYNANGSKLKSSTKGSTSKLLT